MGNSDAISKMLLQNNVYFADTINAMFFDGENVISSDELEELDTTELTVIADGITISLTESEVSDSTEPTVTTDGKGTESEESDATELTTTKNKKEKLETVQRFRDVLKKAIIRKFFNTVFVIIGIENQTEVHYAMPVKNLIIDALRYAKQVSNKAKEHRKNKDTVSSAEFLSGWCKDDVLIPVITLTVYYGTDDWDAPKSIHEMFKGNIDERLLEFIPDYRINLLEPCKITKWDKFKTDIGKLFQIISVSNTEHGIENLINSDKERFGHIETDVIRAINFYTNSNFPIEGGERMGDMCLATRSLIQKSEAKGRAEGREEGRAEGIITMCAEMGMDMEEIIEKVTQKLPDMSVEQIKEIYASVV